MCVLKAPMGISFSETNLIGPIVRLIAGMLTLNAGRSFCLMSWQESNIKPIKLRVICIILFIVLGLQEVNTRCVPQPILSSILRSPELISGSPGVLIIRPHQASVDAIGLQRCRRVQHDGTHFVPPARS